jgi:hypothetical protein
MMIGTDRYEQNNNPLRINMMLYDLAVEYRIKGFRIRGYWIDNIYAAYLSWHHEMKNDVCTLCFAIPKEVLSVERWMDTYSQCQNVIKRRTKRMRQAIIDLIAECGSVQ